MRNTFIRELTSFARHNPKIFLVVADLGFSVVEDFAREFPSQFLNVGVAEQNMTGIAAGLAAEGYHVFTYSIANFPTLRCFEQIRNDICYHQLSVTVVSVGAGFAYGNLGYSHHAVQDLAVMRSLPELTIYSPADPGETCECLAALVANPGPSYLRLGKAGEAHLHEKRGVAAGPLAVATEPSRCALVSHGSILQTTLQTAQRLREKGEPVSVYSVPWFQPLPPDYFRKLEDYSLLFVVEEHLRTGGLYSLLCDQLQGKSTIISYSVPPAVCHCVGSQEFLRQQSGLEPEGLANSILAELNASDSAHRSAR